MKILFTPIVVRKNGNEEVSYRVPSIEFDTTEEFTLENEEARIQYLDSWYNETLGRTYRKLLKDLNRQETNHPGIPVQDYKDETINDRIKRLGVSPWIYRHEYDKTQDKHTLVIKTDPALTKETWQFLIRDLVRQFFKQTEALIVRGEDHDETKTEPLHVNH